MKQILPTTSNPTAIFAGLPANFAGSLACCWPVARLLRRPKCFQPMFSMVFNVF
jgi:hypothetical protein